MKTVLFSVPHGKALRTTQKVYSEGKMVIATDVKFKGNPGIHADILIKTYTAGGALGLIDGMDKVLPIDSYWKNVRGYIMRQINGQPAEKSVKVEEPKFM